MLLFLIILVIVVIATVYWSKKFLVDKLGQERNKLQKTFDDVYKHWQQEKAHYLKQIEQAKQQLEQEKQRLSLKEQSLQKEELRIVNLRKDLEEKLANISKMSKEEIISELKDNFKQELTEYFAEKLRNFEKQFEVSKEDIARQKLLEAMQSVAVDVVSEYVISRIKIPNPEFKGKIIGKDGRNIRTFERLAKVDLIIDESGDTIAISSYDPIRREIARIALQYLIKDGRVHPGTIEEYVKKAQKQLSAQILKYGKELADLAGWYQAPKEALGLIGRMRFRVSMGQNLYQHTAEVIKLSEEIGKLLDLDVRSLKIAALLHDVGKVLTSQVNKPHHHISADLAKKWGLSDKIVNIIEAHHGDIPAKYIECAVLQIADAISGSRPGARKEDVEGFVERVGALEEKALEVAKGKAEEIFALKAGRQLWVVVKPNKVSDDQAALLAHKIAKEVEKSGVFPGEVEVVVVREIKAFAKAHKAKRVK